MKRIASYRINLVREESNLYETNICSTSEKAVEILRKFRGDDIATEYFTLLCLDTKARVIGIHDISNGSLSASIVHPREVFKVAMLNNAASIIVAHNHPSGDPTPSREDISVTQRLVKCGRIMDIPVNDHIILGMSPISFAFTSMKRTDLI